MMGANQLDQLPHITFAIRSLFNYILDPLVMLHHYQDCFCDTSSEFPVSVVISVRGVVLIEVPSCGN